MEQTSRESGQNRSDAATLPSDGHDNAGELQDAIKAAEESMAALKLAKNPSERARHSARLKALLEKAERLKHQARSPRPTVPQSREPRSTRPLSKQEQILLLRASYLNGFKFPPWNATPSPDEFAHVEGEPLFQDTPDLPLSEFQEEVLDAWKRPHEAFPPPTWLSGAIASTGPTLTADRSVDLVQDAATDCSVVASLCAGVARAERGHHRILPNIVHPSDEKTNTLLMSSNGKYVIKLNFNGCYRRVVIDDRLPVSRTNRVIHVVDQQNPGLLWPALVEKAYLKVRGGYDFPGSNSGTDLWILTGWIPEQIFLRSDELEPDRLWKRMQLGHRNGDVLITMGTGKMSARIEKEVGLASEHDYAVLDIREVDGQRLLLVKNPWFEGTSWKGRFALAERDRTTPEDDAEDGLVRTSRDLLNADDELSPGRFWMDLDNVIQHFESIYLNWNSSLFQHRQDVHFMWDLATKQNGRSTPRGRNASLIHNPQFTVTANTNGTVWLILSRHFRNAISAAATDEEIESGKYDIDLKGHISLACFSSSGHRVVLSEKYLYRGWFVDSPQTLMKLDDCHAGMPYTIVPLEQDLVTAQHTFSLAAFSNSALVLTEASPRFAHSISVTSAWTKDCAGGNSHNAAYGTNPQFRLTVKKTTSISLLLEACNDALNVQVKLVSGKGRRVYSVRSRDVVCDSKDYRPGCCVAQHAELEAGEYTVICSTFEPQQLGDFTLYVESSAAVAISPVPKEGAGRVRLALDPVTFTTGQNKVAAPIYPRRLVNFYAVARKATFLQSTSSSNNSLMRIAVESGRGDRRYTHSVSNDGEFCDTAAGIRTNEIDLKPDSRLLNNTWLVLERVPVSSGANEESLSVEIYADQVDAISYDAWRDWDD